jgi:hypothetical protein
MADLIYDLRPGSAGFDFTGVNDYLNGCAIYDSGYGVSGAAGTGELGGFINNIGTKHLSLGTFNSTLFVGNRTAQFALNTTNMEYMIIDLITGDDFNGGERPNDGNEGLKIRCTTGGDTSTTQLVAGGSGYGPYPGVEGGPGWITRQVNIPASNRGNFLWQIFMAASAPEFQGAGGVFANNQNAGDRYAISRLRIYGTVPTTITYFRANDDSPTTLISPGDPVTLSWNTLLGSFAGATSGSINQGIGAISPIGNGSITLNPGPTTETTYTLTVQGPTGSLSSTVTVEMDLPDSDPDLFTFDGVQSAALSTTYTSNTVTISGIETSVTVQASNGAQTSVNGGTFSTANKTISNGQTLRVRMVSSGNYNTAKTTTVQVGSSSATWTITTLTEPAQIPNTFSFNDVQDAGLNTTITSNQVTITGITQSVPVSAPTNGFESSVNGGTFSTAAKTITNGQTLRLRYTTTGNTGETASTIITVGGSPNVSWNVTNQGTADTDPNYFFFDDVDDAAASSLITSSPVLIDGINVPTQVTATNGAEIRVASGSWVAGSTGTTISNGQNLRVRITSSADPGGVVETDVTVGSLSDTFTVTTTTANDTTPDPFYFADRDNQPPNTYIESNVIVLQGITSPSNVVVTGGQFSKNDGTGWSTFAATGQVNNGDQFKVRILTGGLASTSNLSVTIS